MPKGGLLWRFRKRSEKGGIVELPCGCKEWVYTHEIGKYCEYHLAEFMALEKDREREVANV